MNNFRKAIRESLIFDYIQIHYREVAQLENLVKISETCAGFGPVGNTEKKNWLIMRNF